MHRALLSFPELVFEIDAGASEAFASDVEALREGKVPVLTIQQCSSDKQKVINVVASNISEGDYYSKDSQQLTVALSPEAFEHLLFKLGELRDLGGFSTPEFYELYPVDKDGRPIPGAKTLRTYLSKRGPTNEA